MSMADVYADRFARFGLEATYQGTEGGESSDVTVIFEDAGQEFDKGRDAMRAVIKVLRSGFEECPPEGAVFTVDGLAWTVGARLGKADSTNRYQWAVLARADRRFRSGR